MARPSISEVTPRYSSTVKLRFVSSPVRKSRYFSVSTSSASCCGSEPSQLTTAGHVEIVYSPESCSGGSVNPAPGVSMQRSSV